MEQDFYVGRLRDRHGLTVLTPDAEDRATVHRVIYEELCVGVVSDASREEYRRIMRALANEGAEAILLGCTEIDLLVGPQDSPVPVFDTTRLHAERAVELALAGEPDRTCIRLVEGVLPVFVDPSSVVTTAAGTSSCPGPPASRLPQRGHGRGVRWRRGRHDSAALPATSNSHHFRGKTNLTG